ncbi:Cerato-platanin [Mycena maculata]|uniref:Cerato-platanin n=1 Tax=Mycena maculata TaxID=230809 RepID=A0AAD7HSE0_9AGAR|nr:Cerato-platanin [Mycena maculata]
MKFTGLASLILFALGPLATRADTVAYDQTYDDASNSLNIVACSNGANGLESLGFTTFGSLPDFPFIGAAGAVEGFNSVNCGTCWQLTYTAAGVSNTIDILAIDHAGAGTFNIALEAMNTLTDNQAVFLGRVNVTSVQVDRTVCGLPAA